MADIDRIIESIIRGKADEVEKWTREAVAGGEDVQKYSTKG